MMVGVRNFRIIAHIDLGMAAPVERLSRWTGISGREIPKHFAAAAAKAGAQSLFVFSN
jgi:translation elongation factor EF-4